MATKGEPTLEAVGYTALGAATAHKSNKNGNFRISSGDDERQHKRVRFYENEFPETGSLVMVNVCRIEDHDKAYVSLLEYDNIQGIILMSEFTRRRVRNIHKIIRVNCSVVAKVLHINKEKGYINLSKRQVSQEDAVACNDRYHKAKIVREILSRLAERRKYYFEDLYIRIGWPLYKKFGHAYDVFELAILEDKANADPFVDLSIPQDLKVELKSHILRRLAIQPVTLVCGIEVSCFTYDGIDAIREALYAGMAIGTDHTPITIKIFRSPIYILSVTTLKSKAGIILLNTAIRTIREKITTKGGMLNVKMAPKRQ